MFRPTPRQLALVLTVLCAVPAAQAAEWSLRAGPTYVSPKSDNGSLAGGALAADIDDETQLGLTLNARFTPHFALELLAATPFHQMAKLGGAEAVDFRHLPPTLTAQWHFLPESTVSPFVGAGVTYTWIYDEKELGPVAGADVRIDNTWGASAQAGLVFRINERLDLVADARWMDISPDVRVDGAEVGSVDVDPLVYSVMLGWRF